MEKEEESEEKKKKGKYTASYARARPTDVPSSVIFVLCKKEGIIQGRVHSDYCGQLWSMIVKKPTILGDGQAVVLSGPLIYSRLIRSSALVRCILTGIIVVSFDIGYGCLGMYSHGEPQHNLGTKLRISILGVFTVP